MRVFNRIALIATVAASASVLCAAPALAQQGQSQNQQGQAYSAQAPAAQAQQAQPIKVTDKQVGQYAQAIGKLKTIRAKWIKKINNADDQKQAAQYQKQAQKKLVDAVKSTGLSVQEFNKIARASQNDADLAKRIKAAE